MPPNEDIIRGEPLELDVLLAYAEFDTEDIESAAEWWDRHASRPQWIGALDNEPINDNPDS